MHVSVTHNLAMRCGHLLQRVQRLFCLCFLEHSYYRIYDSDCKNYDDISKSFPVHYSHYSGHGCSCDKHKNHETLELVQEFYG